jgi:lipopolysaccharide export system protein LptA
MKTGTARTGLYLALVAALCAMPARAAQEPAKDAAPGKPAPILGPALFDKKKPIEITSDKLDVDQQEKTAIFEGNVDAIQGEVHLKADRLKVYYEEEDAQAGTTGPAPAKGAAPKDPAPKAPAQMPAGAQPGTTDAATDPASGGKIKRMDVDGKVFMSSPTERASGDKAVYLAETGMITLTGNVILTRGQNVIRGTKLVVDADTGHSVIESKQSAGGGRVKGLFVPKQASGQGPTAQAQPQAQTRPKP